MAPTAISCFDGTAWASVVVCWVVVTTRRSVVVCWVVVTTRRSVVVWWISCWKATLWNERVWWPYKVSCKLVRFSIMSCGAMSLEREGLILSKKTLIFTHSYFLMIRSTLFSLSLIGLFNSNLVNFCIQQHVGFYFQFHHDLVNLIIRYFNSVVESFFFSFFNFHFHYMFFLFLVLFSFLFLNFVSIFVLIYIFFVSQFYFFRFIFDF